MHICIHICVYVYALTNVKSTWKDKITLRTLINKENTAESQNDGYILFIL